MDLLSNFITWTETGYHAFYLMGGFIVLVNVVIGSHAYFFRKYGLGSARIINALVTGDKIVYTAVVHHGARKIFFFYILKAVDNTWVKMGNLDTGADEKKQMLYLDRYPIILSSDGLVWVRPEDAIRKNVECNLTAFDSKTLEKVFDLQEVKEEVGFKAGETLADCKVDPAAKELILISNEGNNYSLSYKEGTISKNELSTPPDVQTYFTSVAWADNYEIQHKPNSENYQIYFNKKCISPDHTFFKPTWLHDYYENNKHVGIIFYHAQTTEKCPLISISLLELNGTMRWTIKQQALSMKRNYMGRQECRPAFAGARGDTLVFAVKAPDENDKIITVDAKSGRVGWMKRV